MAEKAISFIINAHGEGLLAHRSMKSALQNVDYAKKQGLDVELIVIIDRPNPETSEYFTRYADSESVKTHSVDLGDLGLARNYGVEQAQGKYIAFMDADNLICKDWLWLAYNYIETQKDEVIVHPNWHVVFESTNVIWEQRPSTDSDFSPLDLVANNYWDSVCLARKDTFLKFPYMVTRIGTGFGPEDWHWNCETIAAGIEHLVVPETVHFRREKETGSLLAAHTQSNAILPATKLFSEEYISNIPDSVLAKEELGQGHHGDFTPNKLQQTAHRFKVKYPNIYLPFKLAKDAVKAVFSDHSRIVEEEFIPRDVTMRNMIPGWLFIKWREIHELEPAIFPTNDVLKHIHVYSLPKTEQGRAYAVMAKEYGNSASHVFLLPFLKKGGGDLVALNYINALVKENLASRIVVVATDYTGSTWQERLPEEVTFINFAEYTANFNDDMRRNVLSKLLVQKKPEVVHIINSRIGYQSLSKHATALTTISRYFASVFTPDITHENQKLGHLYTYLPKCIGSLEQVFSDNAAIIDNLKDLYGFAGDKFQVHYQPVEINASALARRTVKTSATSGGKFKIMWASRMDRQKRPDILLEIARRLETDSDIEFHVFGSEVVDPVIGLGDMSQHKNIAYHGPYDQGLQSLPTEEYDLFLYTSQWDGLPNVLLEAVSLGLPIIAPNVGAVAELIEDERTGALIQDYTDVEAYVNAIVRLKFDYETLREYAENALELVRNRHSQKSFVENIKQFPKYEKSVAH